MLARLALALAALSPLAAAGCVFYVDEDDPPTVPVVDAAWPLPDAGWAPVDAWPNACYAASAWACPSVGGAACFDFPQQLLANPDDSAPALGCTAPAPGATAGPVALAGGLRDLMSLAPVAGQVEVFDALDVAPLVVDAADADGAWDVALPAGTPTALTLRTQGAGYLDVYHPDLRLTDDATQARDAWTVATGVLAALPAFVGVTHEPGTAMVIVDVLDCDGQPVRGAVVTLAEAPGASGACPLFVPEARAFYADGGSGLPVTRDLLASTAAGGRAYLVEAPPSGTNGVQYVQVWGYRDTVAYGLDELALVAELPVHTFGDAVTYVRLRPDL